MIDVWQWVKQQPWWLLLSIPVVFGLAPRFLARAVARAYPKGHPRRAELRAEVEAVPRWEQPLWVFDQLDLVLFDALPLRRQRRLLAWSVAGSGLWRIYCEFRYKRDGGFVLMGMGGLLALWPAAWQTRIPLGLAYSGLCIAIPMMCARVYYRHPSRLVAALRTLPRDKPILIRRLAFVTPVRLWVDRVGLAGGATRRGPGGLRHSDRMPRGAIEERLWQDLGCRIEEFAIGREDEPDIVGFAALWPLDDGGLRVAAYVRPGAPQDDREALADWALTRVPRFIADGPEPDGWQRRATDGGWQLWVRRLTLPSW